MDLKTTPSTTWPVAIIKNHDGDDGTHVVQVASHHQHMAAVCSHPGMAAARSVSSPEDA
jgi:hypothetical protein